MTNTETKFRIWANKEFPNSFIKKIPDYKVLGSAAAIGLPDYMIVDSGETLWYEVKAGFGDTISLKTHFTDGQKIVFHKMFEAGVDVYIYCFTKTCGQKIIKYSELLSCEKIKFSK